MTVWLGGSVRPTLDGRKSDSRYSLANPCSYYSQYGSQAPSRGWIASGNLSRLPSPRAVQNGERQSAPARAGKLRLIIGVAILCNNTCQPPKRGTLPVGDLYYRPASIPHRLQSAEHGSEMRWALGSRLQL